MSRSNPVENSPNPATRWFEWDGSAGGLRYYDKEAKQQVKAEFEQNTDLIESVN